MADAMLSQLELATDNLGLIGAAMAVAEVLNNTLWSGARRPRSC